MKDTELKLEGIRSFIMLHYSQEYIDDILVRFAYEDDQNVDGLTDYAKQKLEVENKRYETFEKNYETQQEFEKNN
ncbi:MAG: hypothetical protein KHY50_01360 [Lactobacillus gasseri]|nr:hypothetical protein [Lactobacillus gasseri]MBS5222778.1 hypothetical protein [Lactobacillus gasseri]